MTKTRLVSLLLLALFLVVAGWTSWNELSKLDLSQGPTRAAWQLPSEVLDALNIKPGSRVADLGAGDGYFTFLLAEAVGPSGRVYAVDVDRPTLERLEKEVQTSDYSNIDVIQGELDDPRLPDASIQVVFLCNTYHHLERQPEYFERLKTDLAPGGRVAVIDMRADVKGIAALFVDEGHWTPWDQLHGDMEIAGYRRLERHEFLPMQNFGIFVPR